MLSTAALWSRSGALVQTRMEMNSTADVTADMASVENYLSNLDMATTEQKQFSKLEDKRMQLARQIKKVNTEIDNVRGKLQPRLHSGDFVAFKVHHGSYLALRDKDQIVARRNVTTGKARSFRIEKDCPQDKPACDINAGDDIYLKSSGGNYVHVDANGQVKCSWPDKGPWQKFSIQKVDGKKLFLGDNIFLNSKNLNRRVDVEMDKVRARFDHFSIAQNLQLLEYSESL